MSAPHCFLHITDRYLKSVIPLSLSITLHESGIEGVKKKPYMDPKYTCPEVSFTIY